MPQAVDRYPARRSVPLSFLLLIAGAVAAAEPQVNWGPYNVTALEGGIGLERALAPTGVAAGGPPWPITGGLRAVRLQSGTVIRAAGGAPPGSVHGDGTSARQDIAAQ